MDRARRRRRHPGPGGDLVRSHLLLGIAAQHSITDLRRQVQQHVGRLPVAFFEDHKSGSLVSRILNDAEGIRNLVGTGFVQLAGGLRGSEFLSPPDVVAGSNKPDKPAAAERARYVTARERSESSPSVVRDRQRTRWGDVARFEGLAVAPGRQFKRGGGQAG